jgi:hypothetical protein
MKDVAYGFVAGMVCVWTLVGIWLLVFAWEDRREQQAIREREDAARRYQSVEPDDVEYGVGA